jgi:hypothetical protein
LCGGELVPKMFNFGFMSDKYKFKNPASAFYEVEQRALITCA